MKFLLDVPFVVALAKWVWGEDELVSPESCLEDFPLFMAVPCWSRLLAKSVGVAIIVLSCLNKAPVMRNILKSESTAGLSRASVYGETIVYANCAFYGILERHPISAYGENVSMTIQSVIILLLIWRFTDDPKIKVQEQLTVLAIAGLYLFVVTAVLPSHLHPVLMTSIYPIMLYSRGTQIYTTLKIGHTGNLSIITTSMSFAGSLVRILTTLKEVGWDFAVLGGFFLSVFLNGLLFVQYFVYRKNTIQFFEQEEKRKEAADKKKAE